MEDAPGKLDRATVDLASFGKITWEFGESIKTAIAHNAPEDRREVVEFWTHILEGLMMALELGMHSNKLPDLQEVLKDFLADVAQSMEEEGSAPAPKFDA